MHPATPDCRTGRAVPPSNCDPLPAGTFGPVLFAVCLLASAAAPAGAPDRTAGLRRQICSAADVSAAAPLFRPFALAALQQGELADSSRFLSDLIVAELDAAGRRAVGGRQLDGLSKAAAAHGLLELFRARHRGPPPSRELLDWLLGTDERMLLFLRTIQPEDRWNVCLAILDLLADHAPGRRGRFLKLMLAFAVVWDSPGGVRPSHAKEEDYLDYVRNNTDMRAYYDYYCGLYDGPRAKVDYRKLAVRDLVWVVDLPIGMDELQWVQEEVRGKASSWGKRYSEIRYSTAKLVQGGSPYGKRTLEQIEQFGGVCVDQAYYAAMTARAYGIPAMTISSLGRTGGHAWVGYLRDEHRGRWDLETGRYAGANFERGTMRHPQTGKRLTEQEFLHSRDRVFRTSASATADAYVRLCSVAMGAGRHETAELCARQAVSLAPIHPGAWDSLESLASRQSDRNASLTVLAERARTFRDYPEVAADVRLRREKLLRELGRHREARAELRRAARLRDGEARSVENASVLRTFESLRQEGRNTTARKELERLLRENRTEGAKAAKLVRRYLAFTKETEQTRSAVRFLTPYLKSMHARFGKGNVLVDTKFLDQLAVAYRNNGDTRKAERLLKDIEEDTFRIKSSELTGIKKSFAEDPEEARRDLEDLLRDAYKDGKTVVPTVRTYLELTNKHGQAREAARFLNRYLDRVARKYPSEDRVVFLRLKVTAFENAGQDDKVARTERRIERY